MKCSFVHYKGAWYSQVANQPKYHWHDEVMVLVSDQEDGGVLADIAFRWYRIKQHFAVRLEVFDEAMGYLNVISDIIDYIVENPVVTPQQFCEKLLEMGYEDDTPYEK